MSGFRPIYKKIWKDPDFQEYTPDDKLFFLYSCTNEAVSESGIYPLSAKTITLETGIPLETVNNLLTNRLSRDRQGLENGLLKNIFYDKEFKLIYVRNIQKYNTGGSPALIYKSISNDYKNSHRSNLWKLFFEDYPKFKNIPQEITQQSQPLSNGSTTLRYDKDNDNHNDKDKIKGIVKGKEELLKEKYGHTVEN
jgi:hypothetical protein